MNEMQTAPTTTDALLPPTETAAEPELSIAEHAAQFSPEGQAAALVEEADPGVDKGPHPSQTQKRTEAGQFAQGRHRAASQRMTAEDVPRLNAERAKRGEVERERDALKAELESLRTARAAQSQPVSAPPPTQRQEPTAKPRQAAASNDPEPDAGDETKYPDGQYDRKFMADYSRWAAREEHRAIAKQAHLESVQRERDQSFGKQIDAAKQKYQDFDAVALAPFSDERLYIADESPVGQFILEDDNGAEVLYHLRKNPDELIQVNSMPILRQLKALSLLSQRLSGSPQTQTQAAATGSAALPSVVRMPPKPPNPVRTEAQRASDGPPATDGSLSIAEHARHFGRR